MTLFAVEAVFPEWALVVICHVLTLTVDIFERI